MLREDTRSYDNKNVSKHYWEGVWCNLIIANDLQMEWQNKNICKYQHTPQETICFSPQVSGRYTGSTHWEQKDQLCRAGRGIHFLLTSSYGETSCTLLFKNKGLAVKCIAFLHNGSQKCGGKWSPWRKEPVVLTSNQQVEPHLKLQN